MHRGGGSIRVGCLLLIADMRQGPVLTCKFRASSKHSHIEALFCAQHYMNDANFAACGAQHET